MKLLKYLPVILIMIFIMISGAIFLPHIGRGVNAEEHGDGHDACADHCKDGDKSIVLSKDSQSLTALKIIEAECAPFIKRIMVAGQIVQDAENTVNVVSSDGGILEKSDVSIGARVNEGDILCSIRNMSTGAVTGLKSPISGVVIGDFSKLGSKVDTISPIYTIADFSKLPAIFDVYEKDIKDIMLHQKVCARSIAYPEKCFDGEIIFISPNLDPDTNTVKIRALLGNPDNFLKLGMSVTADISIESPEKFIILPIEAIHTSAGKKLVFIQVSDEKFEAREVVTGDRSADSIVICSGIARGEKVVTENSFFLKSELLKSSMGDGCAD